MYPAPPVTSTLVIVHLSPIKLPPRPSPAIMRRPIDTTPPSPLHSPQRPTPPERSGGHERTGHHEQPLRNDSRAAALRPRLSAPTGRATTPRHPAPSLLATRP